MGKCHKPPCGDTLGQGELQCCHTFIVCLHPRHEEGCLAEIGAHFHVLCFFLRIFSISHNDIICCCLHRRCLCHHHRCSPMQDTTFHHSSTVKEYPASIVIIYVFIKHIFGRYMAEFQHLLFLSCQFHRSPETASAYAAGIPVHKGKRETAIIIETPFERHNSIKALVIHYCHHLCFAR